MRNLDECKAEIFRRSDERIKERKRNRILACCIPLFVCITVFSAAILPAMMPAKEASFEVDNTATEENDNFGSIVCSYTLAEIQNMSDFPEHYRKITDKVEVTHIFNAIQSLYNGNESAIEINEEVEAESYNQQTDNSSNKNGFMITFTTEDGFETTYTLVGNELNNESTGQKLILSDNQLAELKSVLALSE